MSKSIEPTSAARSRDRAPTGSPVTPTRPRTHLLLAGPAVSLDPDWAVIKAEEREPGLLRPASPRLADSFRQEWNAGVGIKPEPESPAQQPHVVSPARPDHRPQPRNIGSRAEHGGQGRLTQFATLANGTEIFANPEDDDEKLKKYAV